MKDYYEKRVQECGLQYSLIKIGFISKSKELTVRINNISTSEDMLKAINELSEAAAAVEAMKATLESAMKSLEEETDKLGGNN